MAQPTLYNLQYLGAVAIKAGEEYTATDITSDPKFTNATAFMLKTDTLDREDPIKVSINKTPYIPIYLNEITAWDLSTAITYTFNKDCVIAILQNIDITP